MKLMIPMNSPSNLDKKDESKALSYHKRRASERGFTLLELLIAMTIFAMLAVVGWQVFDGLNRAKERAEYHADQLSELQYAYLQMQQDFGQVVAYQQVSAAAPSPTSSSQDLDSLADAAQDSPQAGTSAPQAPKAPPLFNLQPNQVSFVRFADPDPRYQTSTVLVRVEYQFADNKLIRRQFADLNNSAQAVSLDSVLIDEIESGQWQAYNPESSPSFPSGGEDQNSLLMTSANSQNSTAEESAALLPKGVGLSFSYHDMPLDWRFALTAPPPNTAASKAKPTPAP